MQDAPLLLHIAIFGCTQDGNLTDPKPNPNNNTLALTVNLSLQFDLYSQKCSMV